MQKPRRYIEAYSKYVRKRNSPSAKECSYVKAYKGIFSFHRLSLNHLQRLGTCSISNWFQIIWVLCSPVTNAHTVTPVCNDACSPLMGLNTCLNHHLYIMPFKSSGLVCLAFIIRLQSDAVKHVVTGSRYCCCAQYTIGFVLWSLWSWFKTCNAWTGRPGNGGFWRITLSAKISYLWRFIFLVHIIQ